MKQNNATHKVDYNDGILNSQRLMLMTDFLLSHSLEDQYLQHLEELQQQKEWSDFRPVIKETIAEYQITHIEIQQAISDFVRVPAFC